MPISTNSIARSQAAAAAADQFAVERLTERMRTIRNESLSYAEESGYRVETSAVERSSDEPRRRPPERPIEETREGTEARIRGHGDTEVYRLEQSGREAAASLLE